MSGRQQVPQYGGTGASGLSPFSYNTSTRPTTTTSSSSANTQRAQSESDYMPLIPIFVPREHLEEVQRFVLALARGSANSTPSSLRTASVYGDRHQTTTGRERSADDDADDSVELVSMFSRLTTDTTPSPSPLAPRQTLHNNQASMPITPIPARSTNIPITPTPTRSSNARANTYATTPRSTARIPTGSATPAAPIPIPAARRTLSVVPEHLATIANRNSHKHRRYYVILVGKLAGVFWDEWVNVFPVIDGVANARYRGFSTHSEALGYYEAQKAAGVVDINRNPGDDDIFGPRDDAIQ